MALYSLHPGHGPTLAAPFDLYPSIHPYAVDGQHILRGPLSIHPCIRMSGRSCMHSHMPCAVLLLVLPSELRHVIVASDVSFSETSLSNTRHSVELTKLIVKMKLSY